jgi:hypothetical protein
VKPQGGLWIVWIGSAIFSVLVTGAGWWYPIGTLLIFGVSMGLSAKVSKIPFKHAEVEYGEIPEDVE